MEIVDVGIDVLKTNLVTVMIGIRMVCSAVNN